MTQEEEKRLLIKDLCPRLAYGVTYYYDTKNVVTPKQILSLTEINNILLGIGDNIKPYLRPMSSMTDEEKKVVCSMNTISDTELNERLNYQKMYVQNYTIETFDYFNEHHFDFRGLIEKGLALEATEGMYKI